MHRALDDRRRVGRAGSAGHAAAQSQRQALHDSVHGERHDHRRDPEKGDDDAIHEPGGGAHAERESQRIEGPAVLSERAGDEQDRRAVENPGNGEVDAADQDDEGLSCRDQTDERGDGQNGGDARRARESRVHDRADDEQQDRRRIGVDDPSAVFGQSEPLERACARDPSLRHRRRFRMRPMRPPATTAMTRKSPS